MADWQKGDLALCVNDTPNPTFGKCSVAKGRIYLVTGISCEVKPHGLLGASTGLFLGGVEAISTSGAYAAQRFIKVTPPADMLTKPRAEKQGETV